MMAWTDRHCRVLHRRLAPNALLYTEMVTIGAVLFGDADRHLAFSAEERPLALQLGGSEPEDLARAARLAVEGYGYDEVNLNCGCPSERVQRGAFGACLMREPELVADCLRAMREAVDVPVTVKCRIGVDDSADWPFFDRFVSTVAASGCRTFIVHARKAWLKGLSPKENREIPPLRYDLVERLKAERPDLEIILNGGLRHPSDAERALRWADGVMIGREAYENPWSLRAFAAAVQGDTPALRREDVVMAMQRYVDAELRRGTPLGVMVKPMLGLFNGLRGARAWRRTLSEEGRLPDAGADLLLRALREVALPEAA